MKSNNDGRNLQVVHYNYYEYERGKGEEKEKRKRMRKKPFDWFEGKGASRGQISLENPSPCASSDKGKLAPLVFIWLVLLALIKRSRGEGKEKGR